MKLKNIFLGAALAGVTLVSLSNLVQAQVCPRREVVRPAQDTRIIRNERLGYRVRIPSNYRTIAARDNLTVVLDSASFEWTQCRVRNRDYSEYYGITVSASPVKPGNRSIADLVRQQPRDQIIKTTTVASQTAVVYTDGTLGYKKNVSFFTPDRRYMITVSVPYQYKQNSRGEMEWIPISSFEEALNTIVSTFTFVRG